MGQPARIEELLRQWQESFDRGKPLTAEELCRDCPALLPELRRRIAALRSRQPPRGEEWTEVSSAVGPAQHAGEAAAGNLTEVSTFIPSDDQLTPPSLAALVPLPPAPAPEWPSRAGRYHILGLIARGGMGAVLRAQDPDFERTLALKIILPGAAGQPHAERRFLDEAKLTGQLQHPGIPPVHDVGRLGDGRPFFAMKLIQGRTLSALLKERPEPAQDLPRFIGIFEKICETLAYAHAQGIIHRDLKPANIMVGAFGEVQVMDWGLAKVLSKAGGVHSTDHDEAMLVLDDGSALSPLCSDEMSTVTRAGDMMGTPSYIAPEQARGEVGSLDERSDVFGLGAILCEILTGKPPFWAEALSDSVTRAREGDLSEAQQRLKNCSADAELVQLAQRCLAAKKEDRLRHAGEVAEAVVTYQIKVQEQLQQAREERAAAQAKANEERKRRRLTAALAVSLLLLLFGISAGSIWYLQDRAEEAQRKADEIRKVEQAKQNIHEALVQVRRLRGEYHRELQRPGGVFHILNEPARWEGKIKRAKDVLQRAEAIHSSFAGLIDSERTNEIQNLATALRRDETDYALALRLEAIRLDRATLIEGGFDLDKAAEQYPAVLGDIGLSMLAGQEKSVAAGIRQSAIKELLLAALDDWALVSWMQTVRNDPLHRITTSGDLQQRLLKAARLADPDPWHDQVRNPDLWDNVPELEQLAEQALADDDILARLSPQMFDLLGTLLGAQGPTAGKWLMTAQSLYPVDFWLNLNLGNALQESDPVKAVGFYRVALAARPKSSVAYNNLGMVLHQQKDLKGAMDAFRKAVEFNPRHARAYYHLGLVLYEVNRMPEAAEMFHTAIRLDPDHAKTHHHLGLALSDQKKLAEAQAAFRTAIKLEPELAFPHGALGQVLFEQGKFGEAAQAIHHALERLPAFHPLHPEVQWQLQRCRDFAALDKKLPAVLAGDKAKAAELLDMAHICFVHKQRYRAAAQLYQQALTQEPKLADNLDSFARYHAALSALRAIADTSEDGGPLTETERRHLRRQALDWLNAELAAWQKRLDQDLLAIVLLRGYLEHWQHELDLAGVREKKQLARMPDDERKGWQELWTKVEQLTEKLQTAYTESQLHGVLTPLHRRESHPLNMSADKTYIIEMQSLHFNTLLRLEDDRGQQLAENDDIDPTTRNLNSRLIFTPKRDGTYWIIADSFQRQGRGVYTIIIREFEGKHGAK